MKFSYTILLFLIVIKAAQGSWPSFKVPTKEQLLSIGAVQLEGCPIGLGKIVKGAHFPVKSFTPNFCPESWSWVANQTTTCIDLNDLNYMNHHIERIIASDGMTTKSIITAYYGLSGMPLVAFTFETPDNNWTCIDHNSSSQLITCANDS